MPASRFPKASASAPGKTSTEPARRVTLKDIAKALGISAMSVSRALRNQPRISPDLRERVLKTARDLGYRPDPALSALVRYRQGKAHTSINSVLAWFNQWPDPKTLRGFREFDLYWRGAQASAEKLGFRLEEFVIGDAMPPERLQTILHTRHIRGILLAPGPFNFEWLKRFDWSRFAIMGLTNLPESIPIHSVTSHQVHNTMRALEEMRARGYRRIGLVARHWKPRGFGAGYAWDQFYHATDKPIPPFLLNEEAAFAENLRLEAWIREHRPDAILTEFAWMPEKLKSMGIRTPRDMGLAALTILDCPISAGIDQNAEEIGRVGVLELASLINDGDLGFPRVKRQILIEGSWVDGSSLPARRCKVSRAA